MAVEVKYVVIREGEEKMSFRALDRAEKGLYERRGST